MLLTGSPPQSPDPFPTLKGGKGRPRPLWVGARAQPRVGFQWLRVGRCRQLERLALVGGRLRTIDFPALCGLILHPTAGAILYDTGYSEHFQVETEAFPARFYRWLTPVVLPPEERLLAQLASLGVAADDVRLVIVSHFHADHVAGLRDFPRARFLALSGDVAANLGRTGWAALRRAYLPGLLPEDFTQRLTLVDDLPAVDLGPEWAPFARGFDLLGDGSLLGIPLPGHSSAQLGVLLRTDGDRPVLLAADACWSARAWREDRPPSHLARPLFADWRETLATLGRLHALGTRRPDLAILPSHCADTFTTWQRAAAFSLPTRPLPSTPPGLPPRNFHGP